MNFSGQKVETNPVSLNEKLAIYHEWVNDHRRGTYLSRKYGMGRGGIQYLVGLIQKHGEDILDRPQQKYTADFKLAAIDRVLLGSIT